MNTKILVVLVLWRCNSNSSADDITRRIIGGDYEPSAQFPFVAILEDKWTQICDGSILSTSWVLTAGHCVQTWDSSLLDNLRIRVGRNLFSEGVIYKPSRIVLYGGFNRTTMENDIALVQTGTKMMLNNFINVGHIAKVGSTMCFGVGWELNTVLNTPLELKVSKMFLRKIRDCRQSILYESSDLVLSDRNICALSGTKGAPCSGDSGGPLICDGGIVGVVSYALTECGSQRFYVYTNAFAYVPWINGVIFA